MPGTADIILRWSPNRWVGVRVPKNADALKTDLKGFTCRAYDRRSDTWWFPPEYKDRIEQIVRGHLGSSVSMPVIPGTQETTVTASDQTSDTIRTLSQELTRTKYELESLNRHVAQLQTQRSEAAGIKAKLDKLNKEYQRVLTTANYYKRLYEAGQGSTNVQALKNKIREKDLQIAVLNAKVAELMAAQFANVWGNLSKNGYSSRARADSGDYEILGLSPSAPDFVVKAAWRAMASEHHPDKGGDDTKFKEAGAAYDRICKARGI